MSEKKEKVMVVKKKGIADAIGNYMTMKFLIVVLIIIALSICVFSIKNIVAQDEKTTKLGFEDIGELATQEAYCTQVSVTEASRELFGMQIPFTQSKYIYSYDVLIKAGFDFQEIEWSEREHTILVKMPEVKLLSSEIDVESFKVYHDEESIFRPITLKENNQAMKKLRKQAEKDAIANGLLDNAKSNAEVMLKGFFGQEYDLKDYKLVFEYKEEK